MNADQAWNGCRLDNLRDAAARWTRERGRYTPAMLAVTLATTVVILAPTLLFRLERDQAHFAYFAQLWLDGVRPYVDVHAHQWPGQYLLYAVALKLFGMSELSIRIQDLLCQALCACALGASTARFTRPVVGLFAAIVYATGYVMVGPWSTANRETYQVALLLPVLHWVLFADWRPSADRVGALLSGVTVAVVVLIKPTVGLVVVPLAAALVWRTDLPPTRTPARARLAFAVAGAAGLFVIVGALFFGHFSDAVRDLIGFHRDVYGKLDTPLAMHAQLASELARRGLLFTPVACLLVRRPLRRAMVWILLTELALVASIVVQGKALAYHFALLTPFSVLAWLVCAHALVERWSPTLHRAHPAARAPIAAFFVAILATFVRPGADLVALDRYPSVVASYQWKRQGSLGPKWDAAAAWLRAHGDPTREKIHVFGADDGLQFLLHLRNLSTTTAGILDVRNSALNDGPLIVERKRRLVDDLRRQRPEWILVSTFDETWLSRSGSGSLDAFPAFAQLLRDDYELRGDGDYLFYARR